MSRDEVIDLLIAIRYSYSPRLIPLVDRALFINDNARQIEETMAILAMAHKD